MRVGAGIPSVEAGSSDFDDGMMRLDVSVSHHGISPVMGRLLLSAGVAALGCATLPLAASAQTRPAAGTVSQPVVQSLPTRSSLSLNQALARLGQNPRDVDALINAGNAALAMGDVDASVGFFRRADQISPGNGKVKAGLAGALVHSENPYDAIPLFEDAELAGAGASALAGERGLAYDLVGDNDKAQRYYLLALQGESDDEVTRRLALSYAMAGDRKSSEATLTPLLQRQDKAAWRTRAFALAILGQVDDAVSIANTTLPANLASGISPYLRYMPKLTPAQQAAAANLGHFPRASEIGIDDPRVAKYAPKTPRRGAPLQAAADAALTPRGQPLGRNDKTRDSRETRRDRQAKADSALAARPSSSSRMATVPSATPARTAMAQPVRPSTSGELPPVRTTTQTHTAAAAPIAAPVTPPRSAAPGASSLELTPSRTSSAPPPTLGPSLSTSPSLPDPSVSAPPPAAVVHGPPAQVTTVPPPSTLAPVATAVAAAPAPMMPPAPPPKPASLAEAFREFLAPPKVDVAPVAGAVDIRHLTPSRQSEPKGPEAKPGDNKAAQAKAAAAKKPPPPSHPSRIWVQVATGRGKAALAFDWRRLTRENAQALRGKQGYISAWGQTNRLLTGPFPTEAAANSFLTQLRRADIDGAFLWTSPAGQVVDPIAAK
jgi:tetratricopeptide (TPR) repeat protein